MTNEKFIRQAVGVLRRRVPPSLPVSLSFYKHNPDHPVEEVNGYCKKGPKSFRIGLALQDCRECMTQTLLHEWAHARTWASTQAMSYDHDAHFYIELGIVTKEWDEAQASIDT